MPVNDKHVAAMRAQLAGNHEEHGRLLRQIEAAGSMHDYMSLLAAAFLEVIDRRFAIPRQFASFPAAVTEWVADARSRLDQDQWARIEAAATW
jgi:hypothetical protein